MIGAYLDNGEPFRRDLTIRWWEHELYEFSPFSSALAVAEVARIAEPYRTGCRQLLSKLRILDIPDEAAILADGYIDRGIFNRKYAADALHYAIASFYKIDYVVTWNFGFLANVRRQARVRLFNTSAGFFAPVIVTPEFLVSSI